MSLSNSFHEIRFPIDIAFGSSGGPERNTEIITLGSGREKRNQRWAHSRRRYDAGYGVKSLDALHEVIAFYEARRGPLHGFRFRDPLDWKSCAPSVQTEPDDQFIATGDGSTAQFQLRKSYGFGTGAYSREIRKPVAGTVRIAVNGIEKSEGADFTLDATTGIFTLGSHAIPALNSTLTAGFEFDVPVRFASDQMTISLAAFAAGDVPSIQLVEVGP